MSTPAMMSVAQFCAFTGLSKTTAFKLIKLQRIHAVKVLGRTLISHASVETLCSPAAEPPPQVGSNLTRES